MDVQRTAEPEPAPADPIVAAARQATDAPSFYNVANLLLQAGRQIQHDVIQQIVNNPNLDTWQDKALALATA